MNSKLTGQGDAAAEDVPKNALQFSDINQSLQSVDMKTKVVQHVERESE